MSSEGYGSQAKPVPNDSPSAHDRVIEALRARKAFGLAKYSTILQAGNGRDHLVDAYEEALDLVCYLQAAIDERDGVKP